MKLGFTSLALGACISSAYATTTFQGGDPFLAASFDNGLPGAGNDGIFNQNATFGGFAQADATYAGATITVGSAATLTFGADVNAGSTNWIVSGTIIAGDDIFSNNSSITFLEGSSSMVVDDFEAQSAGGGSLNILGGNHSAGDFFGFQGGNNNSTLTFTGGTVTAARLRLDGGAGMGTIGGTATFNGTGIGAAGTALGQIDGAVNFTLDWTGSLTAAGFDGTENWLAAFTAGGFTLDGNVINATSFGENFLVSNNGQTVSLIPEPSSALLGLLGTGLLFIRRRR